MRASRAAVPAAHGDGLIRLALAHPEPVDLDGVFSWMKARAVAGVEQAEDDSYARTLALPRGPGWMRVHRDGAALRLDARVTHPADLPVLVSRARRLFDLDTDPLGIDAALSRHPELAAAVARRPGIRVPGAVDAGEMLIRAMIGQQVTVAAARTALTRLAAALGERLPDGTLLFPTMQAIGEHGADVLRGPGPRIRAITGAAAALAAGDLELAADDDPVRQRAALIAMPGIGPWTADYVRMRVTGDPDVLLPGDVAVRAGAARLGLPGDAKPLTAWAARTAPWRSYLTAHLWRARAVPHERLRRGADRV